MTDHDLYTARIEKIARVLVGTPTDAEWAKTREATKEYFLARARAADKAVLEAIREPTREMVDQLENMNIGYTGEETWVRVHAAIPRGET